MPFLLGGHVESASNAVLKVISGETGMKKKILLCVVFCVFLFLNMTVLHAASTLVANTTLTAFLGAPYDSFGASVDISPSGQFLLLKPSVN
jgi:hypothetical protein